MGSSDPHVPVVVDDTNEAAQFLAVLWFVNSHDGLHLCWQRFDAIASDPVPQVLEFTACEKRLVRVDLKSCLLQSCENPFEFLQVVFESAFRET